MIKYPKDFGYRAFQLSPKRRIAINAERDRRISSENALTVEPLDVFFARGRVVDEPFRSHNGDLGYVLPERHMVDRHADWDSRAERPSLLRRLCRPLPEGSKCFEIVLRQLNLKTLATAPVPLVALGAPD